MSLLRIQKLTMRFGGITAVNELDLNVEPGLIYSVIGPNGAGKTTVFNAITGIYEPTSGEIYFEGRCIRVGLDPRTLLGWLGTSLLVAFGFVVAFNLESLWKAAVTDNYVYGQGFQAAKTVASFFKFLATQPFKQVGGPALLGALIGLSGAVAVWSRTRRTPNLIAANGIARTFQNIRLFREMTVLENVLAGMETKLRTRFWHSALRLPLWWRERRESKAVAMELLKFIGLEEEFDQVARNLPYGHQRRLEIARALAIGPRLLLLDEPAAGMNPTESAELMALIRRIRDRGITILLIEHDMRVVMGISDRIAVLDYGEKIAEGLPAEIRANPRVIEAYLGKEEVA